MHLCFRNPSKNFPGTLRERTFSIKFGTRRFTMAAEIGVGIIGFGLAAKFSTHRLSAPYPALKLVRVRRTHRPTRRTRHIRRRRPCGRRRAARRPGNPADCRRTPNETHYALAKQALSAGKHVVIDKPFAGSSAEAEELVALATAKRSARRAVSTTRAGTVTS